MKKNEMIKAVSAKSEIPQKTVDAVLDAIAEVVIETLEKDKDERIPMPRLGSFKAKHVAERRGVAHIGEQKEWVKKAHYELCFKAAQAVKEF